MVNKQAFVKKKYYVLKSNTFLNANNEEQFYFV